MRFNPHSELQGMHAELSASKYPWIRYSDEKFVEIQRTRLLSQRGTELHDLACTLIRLKQKLPHNNKTLNMYVNDAIGLRMDPEVVVCYSFNAFGTADTISFRDNVLRIHDLKTGVNRAKFDQLMIYAAYFCLEYGVKPADIQIVLRIYQNDEIFEFEPELEDIVAIMDKTVHFDKIINQLREEAYA